MSKKPENKPRKPFNVRQYCVSLLRRGFLRSALRHQVLVENRERRKDPKTGNEVFYLVCAACKSWVKQSEVKIDHIKPIVDPKVGFTNLEDFSNGLYCDISNLQPLCKLCHDDKSKKEREVGTIRRRKEKAKGTKKKSVKKRKK